MKSQRLHGFALIASFALLSGCGGGDSLNSSGPANADSKDVVTNMTPTGGNITDVEKKGAGGGNNFGMPTTQPPK